MVRERVLEREPEPEQPTHYDIQMKRRAQRIEEWRAQRKVLCRGRDLRLELSPVRGIRQGMLVGTDGGCPTVLLDTRILEIPPGGRSSTHRHVSDALIFVLEGQGYSYIGGRELRWERWDALHIPTWTWHYHVNTDPSRPARFVVFTNAPLIELLNLAQIEDIGQRPPPAEPDPRTRVPPVPPRAPTFYERELERAAAIQRKTAEATLITRWREVKLRVNKKGTRSAFLVDPTLGYNTSGLTMVMFQIAPGKWQSKHRHGGEAVLYCVEGRGYSVLDDQRYDWEAGDAVLVGKWTWHQHFNADPDRVATILRVHQWESIQTLMSYVLDPLPMYEEPEVLDAPPLHELRWPGEPHLD
ncbi:MAG TPA: cupin domain-containing protein [Chloroflexota bacterium]|jgi:gentisate 1,2-dioxygenase|nr:cupin domain-containing protein [Chloroflexota bacterium]